MIASMRDVDAAPIDDELDQLIALLRPAIGLADSGRPHSLTQQIASFAHRRHRTAPLLSHYLLSSDDNAADRSAGKAAGNTAYAIEPTVSEHLKSMLRTNILREARQQRVWQRISDIFGNANLMFWGLKGQGIADSLYPFAGARVSKDIDILVHPKDSVAAVQLLVDGGFKIAEKRMTGSSDILHFKSGLSKDAMLYDPQFGQQIELHRRLLYAEPKGLTELVRSKTPSGEFITTQGVSGMLYTIIHGAMDYWSRLKWLVDLSLLCRGIDEERLDALLELSDRFSCMTALIASLYFCEQIFSGSLSDNIIARIAKLATSDKGVSPLITRFTHMLEGHHNYSERSLWRRPDFPTPAWHIFPSLPMRVWLCGYVPLTFIARKVTP